MRKPLVRSVLLAVGLVAARLAAQEAGPSPLAEAGAATQLMPGRWMLAEQQADRALANGFSGTAAGIYRELLGDREVSREARQRMTLSLVTALLESGDLVAAESALAEYDGPKNSTYQLRSGLLAVFGRHKEASRMTVAKAAIEAGRIDELPPTDRGWWSFLQGAVAYQERDTTQANGYFEQAARAATSELQRARFVLAREEVALVTAGTTEAQLNALRAGMERFSGQSSGFDFARYYAAALAAAGRSAEAQAVLNRQLAVVPAAEKNITDQLRLMLGLIAGEGSLAGRQAFRQLLRDAQRPETQRVALQLLVRGARVASEREQLRRDLGELIAATPAHAILEDLLLVRAQLALADKAYAPAEEDARVLLEQFPSSPLKPAALGVRLAVAWDLKRFRGAADVIAQLRAVLAPGRERAELGVLLAEAFFRAEDFRNAADAYDAALHEAPLTVPSGVLVFQRVLSEIRADRLEAAIKELDAAAEGTIDPLNRWQAEWNLVKEMQIRGLAQAALARIERLLAGARAGGVPEDLRIRLMWLRAKLSFDDGRPAAALQQADELLSQVPAAKLEAGLQDNVVSTTLLLRAQALLAADRGQDGLAALAKLRADHHASSAAQYSYLIQAGFLTQRGDLVGAQRVLIDFVDAPEYRQSEFAPLALYQAAVLLERQGLDRQLEDANKLLERLIHDYPRDDIVFYARLKQGDLARKLNYFPQARQIYEYLVNNYPGHPDELLAQLALADSLFAQGSNSVANYESASAIFERLRDLPTAPADLRVEAGFKWGYALAKRGQPAKAQAVFWSVVDTFLLDPVLAAKLGSKGRWWLSKSLLELAQLHEDAGRIDEAQRAYQLIIDNKLSGSALAEAKLARYRPSAGGT